MDKLKKLLSGCLLLRLYSAAVLWLTTERKSMPHRKKAVH